MNDVRLLTGGEAVAHAMRQIDPDVVPVYPITPQTPIIQTFAKFVADGAAQTEIVNVESEHSAMSAAIGAALAGRAHDDRHLVAGPRPDGRDRLHRCVDAGADRDGARQPCALRADQHPLRPLRLDADPRLRRDPAVRRERAGGVRPDVIAPRLAEHPDVLLPVLVCQDGFTITHSAEPVRCSRTRRSRHFVGDYSIPNDVLDVARPTTQGPFAMPDYYYEFRRQQAAAIEASATAFGELAAEFACLSGRNYGEIEEYRLEGAATAIVALGSTAGTVKDVVDDLREEGESVGLLKFMSFRPFPAAAIAAALSGRRLGRRPRPRRLARRHAAAPRRGGGRALRQQLRAQRRRLRPRRARPAPRPTFARSSPAPPRPTSACEVSHVASEDTRAESEGRPAAARADTRSARAAAYRWSSAPSSARSDSPSSWSTRQAASRSRRRATRPPRGTCPGCMSRSRTRPQSRAASRAPSAPCAGGTRCPPTRTSRSSSSRATAERTTSVSRRSPALSSEAIASSSSATTTRPT